MLLWRHTNQREETIVNDVLETIVDHALIAWLWSEFDLNGDPMDATYSVHDVADETRTQWREDIQAFLNESILDLEGMDPGQIGHDFTLTRNGHGVGFWDRGLGERGQRLTDSAQRFSAMTAYESTDGKVRAE